MTKDNQPAGHTAGLERRVVFEGAYDWMRPNPSENYGIGGMRAIFYVIGEKGAVQWMIGLPFYTDSVRPKMAGWDWSTRDLGRPSAWDLGYHASEPQYEGQEPLRECCHIIGGKCFYDGSGLSAEKLIEGFVNGGTDWLWPELEAYWRYTFEGGEYPTLAWSPRPHPSDRRRAQPDQSAQQGEG